MQKLLTIVVPTFNMQAYLKRCLDSLIVEDSLMNRMEVLVINDGSKDESSLIAHGYEQRFPGVFRVIDKENGNYGSCVNRGLLEAEGRFIKILDADDWFDTEVFTAYLRRLGRVDEETDLILTDYTKVDESGAVIRHYTYPIPYDQPFSFQEYKGLDYFAHHSLTYRTGLLKQHGYKQTEGISYTDNEWMYFPQLYVDKSVYWNLDMYRYLMGREGQTMDPKVQLKGIPQRIIILRRMVEVLNSHKGQPEAEGMGYERLRSFVLHTSKGIYQTFLVKLDRKDFLADVLKEFDVFLAGQDRELYDRIGEESVLKGVPVRYVRFWRRFGRRFPVDALRKVFRRIRYGA